MGSATTALDAGMLAVAAGVLVQDGRVLACQRRASGRHPLKWEFPGGKVEAGEDARAALVRELREELDVRATAGNVLHVSTHRYPDDPPVRITFLEVTAIDREPRNRAFAEIRWVGLAALRTLDFIEGDREFVDLLRTGVIVPTPSTRSLQGATAPARSHR
jgi:8-oxo-dGTP diphosphatase